MTIPVIRDGALWLPTEAIPLRSIVRLSWREVEQRQAPSVYQVNVQVAGCTTPSVGPSFGLLADLLEWVRKVAFATQGAL